MNRNKRRSAHEMASEVFELLDDRCRKIKRRAYKVINEEGDEVVNAGYIDRTKKAWVAVGLHRSKKSRRGSW